MSGSVRDRVVDYIVEDFLFGDRGRLPGDDEGLMARGILDSTGVLELIEFIEGEFDVRVDDEETTPDNLGSISGIVRFVSDKLNAVV